MGEENRDLVRRFRFSGDAFTSAIEGDDLISSVSKSFITSSASKSSFLRFDDDEVDDKTVDVE